MAQEKPVTLSGEQFKLFHDDEHVWGKSEWYIEDEYYIINGLENQDQINTLYGDDFKKLPSDAVVVVCGGVICWQGKGELRGANSFGYVGMIEEWLHVQDQSLQNKKKKTLA